MDPEEFLKFAFLVAFLLFVLIWLKTLGDFSSWSAAIESTKHFTVTLTLMMKPNFLNFVAAGLSGMVSLASLI